MDEYGKILQTLIILLVMIRIIPESKYNLSYKLTKHEVTSIPETLSKALMSFFIFACTSFWSLVQFNFGNIYIIDELRKFGVLIFSIGLVILFLSHKSLGSNFSPKIELRENHILVENGMYKYVRHPMYLSYFLITAAILMISSNVIVGLGCMVSWYVLYFFRVKKEEQFMIQEFGDRYIQYMNQVGGIIPKMRKNA